MSQKEKTQSTDRGLSVCANGESNANGGSTAKELPQPGDVHSSEEKSSAEPHNESLSDWFVMVCVLLCNITTGINYVSYGVLYLPLTEKFDASRAAVGWIQGFEFALGSFLGIFFSSAVNTFGCRRPATVGSGLIAAGGILCSLSPNLGWMYLLRGIIPGVGQAMTALSYNVIIQQRFSKHRSLAAGISVIGFSIGNFVGAPLTEFLLNSYGVRGTLALLGAIQTHRIPLSLQLRSPRQFKMTSSQTQTPDAGRPTVSAKLACYFKGLLDFSVLRQTTFLLFCIAGILQKFIVIGYTPHIVNLAISVGLDRELAIWTTPVLSCATLTCRVCVSLVADMKCVNRLAVYSSGLFFAFLACIPVLVFPGIVGTFVSVVFFGTHAGCTHTLLSVVLVDLQGVHQIARCFALFCCFTTFAYLTGSPFMGLLFDITQSYTAGFLVLASTAVSGFSLLVTVCILDHHMRKAKKKILTVVVESQL